MKLKRILAGLMAAVTAVTASVCWMSIGAGAIDIWKNYDVLKNDKKITLTLEPRQNSSTSETIIYMIPVAKSGTLHMDISSETYYVKASFVKKQVTEKSDGSTSAWDENVDNSQISVTMKEGSCFNRYNGDVNFIWDWSSRKSEGSCEFSVEPGEYYVSFTANYDEKGNEDVPFEKIKDEFGNGKITVKLTYPSNEKQNNSSNESTSFRISDLDINPIKNQAYTGKAIKPAVTVKDGDKKLVKGTDYTVSYKNNTKMGTATVTITGKGSYTGTKTLTFRIVPRKTSVSIDEASKSKAVLSWKKSSGAAGYEIWCSTNGESYTKLSTIKSAKTLTKTISKLNTQKNVYKFRVRPYAKVNGKTVYGSWSNIVSAG